MDDSSQIGLIPMTKPKSVPQRVAIIGAGIAGLTAAHRLTTKGHSVRLFEATNRIGGAIRTEISDGWLVEGGPNSLLLNHPNAEYLIHELNLESELQESNPTARKRYIVRGGKPIAVPLSPFALLGSPLFSIGAKLRILAEMRQRPLTRRSDLTIEEFTRFHFGQEVVTYALNPFVAGVYAGNPSRLSARFAFPNIWEMEKMDGSLLRSQAKTAKANGGRPSARIVSFRRGLQTLPDTLAARLAAGILETGARVETLLPGPPWNVVWSNGLATRTEAFDYVLATIPGHALAKLRFGALGERPLASLDAIEHPPVSSLFLGYRRDQVAHPLDGFGLLVPEIEKRRILGVLFSSTLFPQRAPENHVALTVLVGGTRSPEIARLDSGQLLDLITPNLQTLLGVRGQPVFQHHTYWPQAIPQYNLGYDRYFEVMEEVERRNARLFFGGQVKDGISLPSCIKAGERLAGYVN
jgi:oxygen-dependent protoporphyrinogen oxidase